MKREQVRVDADVLTTAEAAAVLRVSVDTLLASRDGPPWFTLGRRDSKRPHRLYLRESVLEWARRRQAAA